MNRTSHFFKDSVWIILLSLIIIFNSIICDNNGADINHRNPHMFVPPLPPHLDRKPSKISYKKCRNIFWLHAPKTASTFCTTLSHVCCTSAFNESVSHLDSSVTFESRIRWSCATPKVILRSLISFVVAVVVLRFQALITHNLYL